MDKRYCPKCMREIGLQSNGVLRPHKNSRKQHCKGSGMQGLDPTDNSTPSVSSSPSWTLEEELQNGWITQAEYDRRKARRDEILLEREVVDRMVADLHDWWIELADREAGATIRKAIEYGATDLRDLGFQIMEMGGRNPHQPQNLQLRLVPKNMEAYATIVGIAFYAQGKLSRIVAAIKEGRWPSRDSWHDLGVYARMAQRVHETGGWPGTAEEDD